MPSQLNTILKKKRLFRRGAVLCSIEQFFFSQKQMIVDSVNRMHKKHCWGYHRWYACCAHHQSPWCGCARVYMCVCVCVCQISHTHTDVCVCDIWQKPPGRIIIINNERYSYFIDVDGGLGVWTAFVVNRLPVWCVFCLRKFLDASKLKHVRFQCTATANSHRDDFNADQPMKTDEKSRHQIRQNTFDSMSTVCVYADAYGVEPSLCTIPHIILVTNIAYQIRV